MARKLKLSLVLSTVQVVTTTILTVWAGQVDWILLGSKRAPGRFGRLYLLVIEARTIWRGVNAPALLSKGLGWLLPNFWLAGVDVDDLLYIAFTGALWYFVGRLLDRRRTSVALTTNEITIGDATVFLLLMAVGGFLLLAGLWTIRDELAFAGSYFLRVDHFIVAALFLAWSFILLIFPGRRLARGVRRKQAKAGTAV